MIAMAGHLISELKIELDGLPRALTPNEIELSLHIRQHLLPDLDALLSDYNTEDLLIDELVLELGTHPRDTPWNVLRQDIERRLRHALEKANQEKKVRLDSRALSHTPDHMRNYVRKAPPIHNQGTANSVTSPGRLTDTVYEPFAPDNLANPILSQSIFDKHRNHQQDNSPSTRTIPIWKIHSALHPFLMLPTADRTSDQIGKEADIGPAIEVIAATISLVVCDRLIQVSDLHSQGITADPNGTRDDSQTLHILLETLIHIIRQENTQLATQLSERIKQRLNQSISNKVVEVPKEDSDSLADSNPLDSALSPQTLAESGNRSPDYNQPPAINTQNRSSKPFDGDLPDAPLHPFMRSEVEVTFQSADVDTHRENKTPDNYETTFGNTDRSALLPEDKPTINPISNPTSSEYIAESSSNVEEPEYNNATTGRNDGLPPIQTTADASSSLRRLLAGDFPQRRIANSSRRLQPGMGLEEALRKRTRNSDRSNDLPDNRDHEIKTNDRDELESLTEPHFSNKMNSGSTIAPHADNPEHQAFESHHTGNQDATINVGEPTPNESDPPSIANGDQQYLLHGSINDDRHNDKAVVKKKLSAYSTNGDQLENGTSSRYDAKLQGNTDPSSQYNLLSDSSIQASGLNAKYEPRNSEPGAGDPPKNDRSKLEALATVLIESALDSSAKLLQQKLISQLADVENPVLFASRAIVAIAKGSTIAPGEIETEPSVLSPDSAHALAEMTRRNLQPDELGDLASLLANPSSNTEHLVKAAEQFESTGIYTSLQVQPELVLATLLSLNSLSLRASLQNDPVTRDNLAILSDTHFDKLTHFLNPKWDSKEGTVLRTLRSAVPADKVTLLKRYALNSAITEQARLALNNSYKPGLAIEHAVQALADSTLEASALTSQLRSNLKKVQLPEIPVIVSALSKLESRLALEIASTQNTPFPSTQDTDCESSINTFETNVAGLVLLGPFIPALFERTGLIINNNFPSPREQVTAASLLTWLVQGDSALGSKPGPLERLLCGISAGTVSTAVEQPSAETGELIESLLSTVCERWAPLANTSNQGLRETFLARDGLLLLEPRTELTVHHKTFDVLLQQLPWTIGQLYLPWLDGPLQVHWKFNG